MKTFLSILALVSTLTLAQAQNFLSNMNGAQDGGGARQGIGTVNLTLSGTTLTLSGSFSGISSAATAAHIHGPGAVGVSAGVLYDLGTPGIVSIGVTAGAINGSLSMLAGTGGFTLADQISQLNNGLWYINIHDAPFPGGEIRGQILPVPEPATWALGGLGLLGLLVWKRRK